MSTTRLPTGLLHVLPMPGQIQEFARAGKLVPVDSAIDLASIRAQYAQTWTDLTPVTLQGGIA